MRNSCTGFVGRLLPTLALVMMVASIASAGAVPDPNVPGPYGVGHTSFVLTDDGRMTVDYYVGTVSRPIPVDLFYPADVGSSPTPAIYALDQIHFGIPTLSSEWEAQGIDPAHEEPPASGAGPFPLVLFSPGWGASALSGLYIATRLASHGFVVALIYHYGDGLLYDYYEPFDNLAVALLNRPMDLSFTSPRCSSGTRRRAT